MSLNPRRVTFTGIEGNKLEGDLYGHGERAALLLHGGGQTRHAWRSTARELAKRGFTAIAVDQRGHGDSAWIESGAYGLRDYGMEAASLADQIQRRLGTKASAIGASLGGLASLLALERADCFSSLVLVDIAPHVEADGVAHVETFMRAHAQKGFSSIDEAAESIAAYLPHRVKPRSVEGLRKNLRLRDNGRWYWHWDPRFLDGPRSVTVERDYVSSLLEQTARSLTIPVLLIRGGSSEIVSLENVEAFRKLVPHAKFVDVCGAGHMVAGDNNDVFSDAVLSFLG